MPNQSKRSKRGRKSILTAAQKQTNCVGADTDYRAKVWNSILRLAWTQARRVAPKAGMVSVKKLTARDWSTNIEREPLSDEQTQTLGLLLLCNTAIEARANHLLDWLCEDKRIKPELATALKYMPIDHRWFLISPLVGKGELDASRPPHQAVAQICSYRNDVVHVIFSKLRKKKLPSPSCVVSLWNNLLDAFEDMNTRLGRGRRTEPCAHITDLKFRQRPETRR